MTTIYIPRPIRTVEDAEGLPEGTIITGTRQWRDHTLRLVAIKDGGEFEGNDCVFNGMDEWDAITSFTALVPVEATEVYGARDKAGAVSRADAGTVDPRAKMEKHITERRALGHADTLVSRPALPWEAVEEA